MYDNLLFFSYLCNGLFKGSFTSDIHCPRFKPPVNENYLHE
ncbi:hypothetical protein IMSAGC014_00303 [Bacteroidaceae bacterium]|nr:hypothetical protein IMSAGC014_00303 [Bacteroidaceae bacterium]